MEDERGPAAGLVEGPRQWGRQSAIQPELLRAACDAMACACWVTDSHGRLIYRNPAAIELLGSWVEGSLDDADDHGWTVVDQRGRPLTPGQLPSREAIASGQPCRRRLIGLSGPNGELLWLLTDAVPVRGGDGGVHWAVTTAADVTLAQQAESALRGSEERYRRIVETTHEGICVADTRSRITYVNGRLCEMLGYTAAELLGQPSHRLLGRPGPSYLQAVPAKQKAVQRDVALRHKDGTTVWAIVNGTMMVDDDGRPSGTLALFTNVTERKLSEDALKRSEGRFRALIEKSADLIAIVDQEGKLLYGSPSMERFLGLRRDEATVAGQERVQPEDLDGLRALFHELSAQPGSSRPISFRFQHPDGSLHFVEGVATNLLEDRAVGGIVLNLRDVTSRKLAEERARVAAARLEGLTADAIITTDPQGRVRSWNDGAERLFGWTRAEALGTVLPFVPDDLLAEALADLHAILHSGSSLTRETIRVSRDGERISLLGSWSPIPLDNGQTGLLAILKDTRPLKEAHRQLKAQAESLALVRERQRIAMDLHDGVIQSLYGVSLELGALRRSNVPSQGRPAGAVTAVDTLDRAIAQIGASIESIRKYIFDLRDEALEERNLVLAARRLAEQFESNSGIPTRLEVGGQVPAMSAAKVTGLLRICQEALANVARHAGATHVRLRIGCADGRIELLVVDDGRGFDPGLGGRRQGDGLHNMRERARLLGAELGVESMPGEGTTVRVALSLS